MRIRRVWALAAIALAAACSSQSEPDAPVDPGPRTIGGRAVVGLEADPGTLNPVLMTNAQAARVFALLQPGLLQLDPASGEWRPGLARRFELSTDSTRVRLTLDAALRWSDGEPFVARDIQASYTLYGDPAVGYPRRSRLESIASVDVEDDSTLSIRFSSRFADPLALLAHDILPSHVVTQLDLSAPESWEIGRRPVTLGAYRLSEWTTDDRLLLERNPHHPGEPRGLDQIEIRIVPDAGARLIQLRTGELDLVPSIPASQADALRNEPEIVVHSVNGRSVAFLEYDLKDERLADPRVREAIGLAIDTEALIAGPLFGFAEPAASFLPPVSWAHDRNLRAPERDLTRARKLLAQSGHASLSLTMHTVPGDPIREAVATAIQFQLSEVGIAVELRPMELASLLQALQSEPFDLVFLQLSGPVDADLRPFLTTDGRFNFGDFSDAHFDQLAEEAATALDRSRARDAAARFQQLLLLERPIRCLYYPATLVANRQRLKGVSPDWLTPFAAVQEWWVTDVPASALR